MAHLLRPGESSLLSELRKSGYYVWMNARNDLYAAQYPGWLEQNADEIFYGGNSVPAPGPERKNPRGPREGKQFYSHYEGKLGLDSQGRNYSRNDEAVDAAIERLQHLPEDQPLCMFLGLMWPHTPYAAEDPYYSQIDRSKVPPRVRAEDCTGKPLMERRLRELQHMQGYTEEEWTELRAVYLAMCSKVDAQFSRLCAALQQAGIYDDCAIFFLSDHGDFAGDYGLPEKAQNCFEDCLTRVPFLIKPPAGDKLDPGICDELMELVDFTPPLWILRRCHHSVPNSGKVFGRSWRTAARQGDSMYSPREGGCRGETHCDESHINGPTALLRPLYTGPVRQPSVMTLRTSREI